MDLVVGIDLGTTNSAVARLDEHGRPVVVPNRLGQSITPSVVAFRDDGVLVGEEAKELLAAGDPAVAAFFKRQMGQPGYVFPAAGRDHSAVDLSARLLAALIADAEVATGRSVAGAVVTVPAYFRNGEREATLEASRRAGLHVLGVVNEPTAAAVAYCGTRAASGETLLVYDLGGGTFDVTLLRVEPDEIRILTSDGDHELGGKDWDDRVVEFLASRFEAEHGSDPLEDMESFGDLLVRAEEAKRRLSAVTTTPVSIAHAGDRGRYDLGRETFEEITRDLLDRTEALTRRVLEEQGLEAAAVDGALLVGGSTRMPMVRSLVERLFGRPPRTGVDPDEAVALGAAVVAAERAAADGERPVPRLPGARRTVDVTNHSLGMIALNEDRSAYVNSRILPKDTAIPCRERRPYQHRTRATGDNRLEIFMTQGETDSPADPAYLGCYVVTGIPHGPGGATVVDVEYEYDESGTVRVAARARGAAHDLQVAVEPLPPDVPVRFLRPPELEVEPVHVTAYLVIDTSGSMYCSGSRGTALEEAQRAARGFLHEIDLAHCSLGVVAFADQVVVEQAACQDARAIERAIDRLDRSDTGGGTSANPFVDVQRMLASREGPRFVVTLTDGEWVQQQAAIAAARACHSDGIETIAIGFGDADEDFLRRIASSDQASFFTSLGGLVDTFTSIAQVLTESHGGTAPPPVARRGGDGGLLGWLSGRR